MRNGRGLCLLALLAALLLWGCSKDSTSPVEDAQAEAAAKEENCVGCHGLPPVSPCEEPAGWERVENYPGGGATHAIHVDFIRTKIEGVGLTPTIADLCAPCHGASPGEAAHHNESASPECWEWAETVQAKVDLIDGSGNFGPDALYNDLPVQTTASTKGGEPQQCASFNCHGASAPVNPEMTLLWDFTCEEYASDDSVRSVYNEWGHDIACAGCHGHDPATPELRTRIIIKAEGATVYDSDDPRTLPHGVAANYFGTVSGLGYGGHGDAQISDVDDPNFIDSAPAWSLPLACTECHDDEASHYPTDSSNTHRLTNQILEDSTHTSAGRCNSCHPGEDYPGANNPEDSWRHHPSYQHWVWNPQGWYELQDVATASSQEIMYPVDEWTLWEMMNNGSYMQTAYGAANTPGDVDYYVNWWGDALGEIQNPPPAPEPFAVLPLARYLLLGDETDRVQCVTCHNPHGTDITISDAMLRADTFNSRLCWACH